MLIRFGDRADRVHERSNDLLAFALALLVPGLALLYLIPLWGLVLLLGALGAGILWLRAGGPA